MRVLFKYSVLEVLTQNTQLVYNSNIAKTQYLARHWREGIMRKGSFGDTEVKEAAPAAWARRGEAVFTCGKKDGVLSRGSVESMDGAGTIFFSERKYVPGEEVGVQFNYGLGGNEFGARLLKGRIKSCRALAAAGTGRLCRAEACWTSASCAAL